MGDDSRVSYAPGRVELRHQRRWRANGAHATPQDDGRDPVYVFVAPPFTTGDLHMGHIRSYAIADAYARFRRATGSAVLFAVGFDSFGLPAELTASMNGEPTHEWVDRCAQRMREQMDRMGFSFDWEREYVTSEPTLYRWSQWLFLWLLERGLIYERAGLVDWCDGCGTTLASLQVEDGACWRCHTPVRVVEQQAWYLKIAPYVAENARRQEQMPGIDRQWLSGQRSVLGRIEGVEIDAFDDSGRRLRVFTPHPDAIAAARFVAMSPRHPGIRDWISPAARRHLMDMMRASGIQRQDRGAADIPVIPAGRGLRVPGISAPLPLLITPAVDARYGEIAVLGIPEADRTDAILGRRLPDDNGAAVDPVLLAQGARAVVHHRVRDFVISRQRAWGAPIPIVHCRACGSVPVDAAELPVRLPPNLLSTRTGNALAYRPDFVETTCPCCGGPGRRETDTLDTHFDGLWWWFASCVPRAARADALFEHEELRRWLPGDCMIWGADGANYVFDQRVVAKALRDHGVFPWLEDGEPFSGAVIHGMVHLDGRKMSKHLGNVVEPGEIVEQLGADTLRVAVLVAAAPRSGMQWSENGLRRGHDFLQELWTYTLERCTRAMPAEAAIEESDPLRRRLARWCEAATRRVTEDLYAINLHRALDNVIQLLGNVQKFEARARERRGELTSDDDDAIVLALELLICLLAPFAPHICDELWELTGHADTATARAWPTSDWTMTAQPPTHPPSSSAAETPGRP